MLSKADILGAQDFKIESVDVPEWGGTVYVKSLTSRQRDEMERRVTGKEMDNLRALFVVWCVCDEKGAPLFDESDLEAISNKSGAATGRIFNKIMELTQFSDDDLEDLTKN